MPQLNSVVLKDNAAVDHTFIPRGINGGVATLASGTGVPIGNLSITASHSRTQQGREKVVFKITLPVVQNVVVAGVTKPTVVRAAYCDIAFSFDSTSETAERADAIAYAKNLLASTLGIAMIRDLEDAY